MTVSLTASVKVSVNAEYVNSMDVGQTEQSVDWGALVTLTNGTGANNANRLFSDTRTINASSSEDLDLAGVLTDAFGNTLTFDKIKALIVKAAAANTNDVLVGGAASAQASAFFGDATDVVKVKPGGVVAFIAPDATGYDITATSADLLKVANSGAGTSVDYTIIIIGVV